MVFRNEIRTEIEIDATPQEVWDVLTDFPAHPEWNPSMEAIEGAPVAGSRLRVTFALPSGRRMRMSPRVQVAERNREFRWLGRLFVPGLFDGEHRFEIHERRLGGVTLVQGERFRGLLVPLMRRMIEVDTVARFRAMNEALARRVVSARTAA